MARKARLILVAAVVLAVAGALWAQAAPVPGPASTTRDAKGVWFIEASSIKDAFDAMGYAVATDRMWQVEIYYRSATGRLSEILGDSQLETDMFMRTIGYTKAEYKKGFKKLSKDARDAIDGFVAGFNRRVDEARANPALLPFEYQALSAQLHTQVLPEKWTRYDIMAWLVLLQREFDPEALKMGQLENAVIAQTLQDMYGQAGLAMFADMRWLNDPQALTYIPSSGHGPDAPQLDRAAELNRLSENLAALPDLSRQTAELQGLLERVEENLDRINARVKMGSYAWVVSGSKTASGHPILYSGPQMGFPAPSIVCEGSIQTPTLNYSGMTVPGIPGLIIARTPHHAWSMQVGHAHTTDYYVESVLAPKLHHVETIHVFGQPDVKLKVFRTSHGPVINPLPYDRTNLTGPTVAWKNAHWGHEWEALDGFLELARATSMAQFGQGIEKICVSQHFCYADRDGNIAYWMSGWDPVRSANQDPRLPSPGDFQHEWTRAMKPRAHAENPAQGYFCGWNNKASINYDNAPQNLSYNFGPFHGAHVVDDYLKTHNHLTFEEVRDLALNISTTDSFAIGRGVVWSQVGPFFTAAVNAYPAPHRLAALALINAWDGHFVAGGPSQWATGTTRADAWYLQEEWTKEFIKFVMANEVGTTLGAPTMNNLNVCLHALKGSSSGVVNLYNWFKDTQHVGLPEDPQQLIVLALDSVMSRIGMPPYNVPRGTINHRHDLLGTVHTTPYANRSTYAHCVEYGPSGPVRIETMFPLGESGFIGMGAQGQPLFDPNYFSMSPVYDPFTPRSFPLFQ